MSSQIVEASWSDERTTLHSSLDPTLRRILVVAAGHGSMDGTRAMVAQVDALRALVPGLVLQVLLDITQLSGTPLRAQLTLGSWLLRSKAHFSRIAVVATSNVEVTLARLVFKTAGLGASASVVATREQAINILQRS